MAYTHRTRLINPRLGTYFGIFASAFVGLVLLLAIVEQLGVGEATLGKLMFALPLGLYAAIGIAAYTREPLEFFASGRRVPAVYNGLGLASTAMGATGIVTLSGAFFIVGFDALCVMLGGLAGFVVMAVLLAPFFRKFGAFTMPSYLGRRFESRALRVLAAILLAVPILLVIAAELRVGGYAAAWLTGLSPSAAMAVLVAVLVGVLIAGGMRSLTWCNVAQGIAMLLALAVPVSIVAVMVTNMPVPQLSHGPLLRGLLKIEAQQGLPIIVPPLLGFELPGEGLQQMAKRFTAPFGLVGPGGFVVATLTIMAGVAAAPWLLPRIATAPGVYEARKSLGWATFLFGLILLTVSSVAVFMRDAILDIVTVEGVPQIPEWLSQLVALGRAEIDTRSTRLSATAISVQRDAVLFALPMTLGMPAVVVQTALAGAVAAALAGAGAAVVALGNMLGEDVVNGLSWQPAEPQLRLGVGRFGIVVAVAVGWAIAQFAPTDPLRLVLWAFAITGSAAFPVMVLSIWWKRLNAYGAMAGLSTGFAVAILAIVAGEARWIETDSALAAVFGIPLSTATLLLVSVMTPRPSRHVLELVRDIRVPGGEIIHDRETRLARLRQRARS
jgi:cation/acetate symporter